MRDPDDVTRRRVRTMGVRRVYFKQLLDPSRARAYDGPMTIPAVWTALLLPQAITAHDTLLVRALPPVRSGFEQVAFVASGLTSILLLVLVVLAHHRPVRGARSGRARRARDSDVLLKDLRPLVEQALAASESVKQTADHIHQEVTSVHESVQATTNRVRKTVSDFADRVDDFNDLLGKVHQRADQAVEVASTAIAGLAWGARTLKSRRKKKKRKRRARSAEGNGAPIRRTRPGADRCSPSLTLTLAMPRRSRCSRSCSRPTPGRGPPGYAHPPR